MIVDSISVKTILGFPGYAVSKDGRVWSNTRKSFHKGHVLKGRWLKPYIDSYGYFQVSLQKKGRRICRLISRLVLETFVGLRPKGTQCRHLDGNNQNNHLENLCWGTPKENAQDSIRHGTNGVKLNEEQVRIIFHAYHDGHYTQREIAKAFGVTPSHVSLIARKKTWSHLWDSN